ncbi:MAG: filamentous hemagglutinin N-terminal domain-containing protein, partial [Leptolyngbyaceae cyanobacterium MO_188.B28]|nr:filamentous hemagglutinin N-terminal domain-containing protein [Leptolyngbyaceae cyanobacterium MO_188.B28]
MSCPRCARWIHLGLAILTSSFASAVNAATVESYLNDSAEWEAPSSLTIPVSTTVDAIAPPSSEAPEAPPELTAEPPSEEELATSEPPNSSDQSFEATPVEAFPSVRVLLPGETMSDGEGLAPSEPPNSSDQPFEATPVEAFPSVRVLLPDETMSEEDEKLETNSLSNQALAALDISSDQRLESGHGDKLPSGESKEQGLDLQDSLRSADALPDGAVPRSIIIPPDAPGISDVSGDILMAQVTPDATMPSEASVVTPDVMVRNDLADLIEGGATRGANLFHSFQEFNVNTGQRVYFANPSGIENILGRVTGSNLSDIDGLLGVDGAANLFLLNPNGIIFGPNAELDVSGSFLASTGDSFAFADGSEFGAVNPQAGALLSVSVPLGVQYNNSPQGDIASTGVLETGQDLRLLGNQLYLEGQLVAGGDLTLQAEDTVTIRDTVTDAFVARAGGDLTIQGNQGVDIWTLQHLEQTPFVSGGDLTLISDGIISADAHFFSWGNFSIEDLEGNPGQSASRFDPIISAIGDVTFGDYTGVALKVEATGSIFVDGDVTITGPDTMLTGDNNPNSDISVLSDSAALILRAGEDIGNIPSGDFVVVPPNSTIPTNLSPSPANENPLTNPITNEAWPTGSILIQGNLDTSGETPGPIMLSATGDVVVNGDVNTSANSSIPNVSAGSFIIDADGAVTLSNGFLLATAQGDGDGGKIDIQGFSVDLNSYTIDAAAFGFGNTGSTQISATDDDVTLSNGIIYGDSFSSDSERTFIVIEAVNGSINLDRYSLDGSRSNTDNDPNTPSVGNVIFLEAGENIEITNSQIRTDNSGAGTGGLIVLDAGEKISIIDNTPSITGDTVVSANASAGGNAGTIDIRGGAIVIQGETLNPDDKPDKPIVSSTSEGNNNGSFEFGGSSFEFGQITIEATDGSVLIDNSDVKADALEGGIAGDILIQGVDAVDLVDSFVSSTTDAFFADAFFAEGGTITIEATDGSVLIDNSDVKADALEGGIAGDILIQGVDA